MISKEEILERARVLSLEPSVVEKDYVLGWLLHCIGSHSELAERWVFKGGTCLKKILFETYRFSEDLDFTLRDPSHLDPAFLERRYRVVEDPGVRAAREQHEPAGTIFFRQSAHNGAAAAYSGARVLGHYRAELLTALG